MVRPLRIEYPDAFYHITSRGNERANIFRVEKDYERFLGYLESATNCHKVGVRSTLLTTVWYSVIFFLWFDP